MKNSTNAKKLALKLIIIYFIVTFTTGCVSTQELQHSMDAIDSFWGGINSKTLASQGSRTYSNNVDKCMKAAKNAAGQLGFTIIEESSNSLIVQSLTPNPFTKEEYQAIKEIEEPIMQAMASNYVGKFYSTIFVLDDSGNFYITARIEILSIRSQEESSVKIAFKLHPKNKSKWIIYGTNPPPEAVKKGLEKWWNAFEENLIELMEPA
ncbi:hypothetical protein [Nitrosomonas marina]|uniref:Uncharacterized protein n=1 Tax=Nitrosomonas marina TaxID=917 RepID=A0A1H8IZJ9_9PROT|nr:hypothetical protein [Nitrosomonas marina]SEN73148.1 hypothetical protein SAMN05216325_1444 [Nitrosomonas marina]